VPVINALTDLLHPCQGLADAFTVWEQARLAKRPGSETAAEFFAGSHRWAYLGDGNNVAHSLMLTATDLGVTFAFAGPQGQMPDSEVVASARTLHPAGDAGVILGSDPQAAVAGADMVYTDTWVSMGQEGDKSAEAMLNLYEGFQVDAAMMARAKAGAPFLHCLPAEPGVEVSTEVLRGPQSAVLDQAENRLWTSMALLAGHVYK